MSMDTVFEIKVMLDRDWAGSMTPYRVEYKGRMVGPLDAGGVERQVASAIELEMHNVEWARSRRNGVR